MNIRLADTAAQYRRLRAEIDAAVARVLDSGSYIGGPENVALERELAAYLGVTEVVAVNSGTDALLLTLKALGIGEGDEVIVPSYTFFATAEAVSLAGAQPRFADCAPGSFNVDVDSVERAWTPNAKAVIAVHLFGEAVDLAPIEAFCAQRGLHLIEDAAQALGATYCGRRVGSLGIAAALSFYPTKTLAACGDAGAISCDDAKLAARLRVLRNHGRDGAQHVAIGQNSRLDEIQAAILRVKLRYLDEWNLRRCAIAARYRDGLRGTHCEHLVREQSVYCQFVVSHPERDALRAFLAGNGIETAIYYSIPCHLQMPYLAESEKILSLPLAERYSRHALALPIHPELADEEIARIVELVCAFERG